MYRYTAQNQPNSAGLNRSEAVCIEPDSSSVQALVVGIAEEPELDRLAIWHWFRHWFGTESKSVLTPTQNGLRTE
ncbi:MAG: hypothetical protein MUF72_18685 [Elainella sp. Prado103]|nr:hypothetical protein [Elainella sp. Prado103]